MAVIFRRPDVVVERGPRDTLRVIVSGAGLSIEQTSSALGRQDVDELVAALIGWRAGTGLRNDLRRRAPIR